jgi:hypothetical protein
LGLSSLGSLQSLVAVLRAWRDPILGYASHEIERTVRDVLIRAIHSTSPKSSSDLPNWIQQRIDHLETDGFDLRYHCKFVLGALPVHATLVYLWAIRPDGKVICIDHEAFGRPSEVETSALRQFSAYVHGAETYPELNAAIPQPPEGATACGDCAAKGYSEQVRHCFTCSGIGWTIRE